MKDLNQAMNNIILEEEEEENWYLKLNLKVRMKTRMMPVMQGFV